MHRSDVPTPALLVDIDILDRNIAIMRDGAAALGVNLRPHAKAHKCVEIAQRIMAAGAMGGGPAGTTGGTASRPAGAPAPPAPPTAVSFMYVTTKRPLSGTITNSCWPGRQDWTGCSA